MQNTFMNSCRFPNPKMNQCVTISDQKTSEHNVDEDNDDGIPDLLDHNDDRITDGDYDPRGEDCISEDEEEEDEDDDVEDHDEEDEGCLHCHSMSNDIQVHCDECQAYVCEACHWCHEYQANHEIRVCDRCDAFYCRGCDEMDQCEDCGEVVCASCSTLLSCKFCGGGLCEECATACGRCGIVLCSRDAKFAVECDTCRLSYCLVCLASGSKDPCVRCGHRPSKRMEQLVHLRLKSIYKAFKQSSSNPSGKMGPYPGHGGRNTTTIEELEDYDTEGYEPDPGILMAAKAASGHMSDPTTSALHYAAREMDLEHALVENYIQEKQKADAAAEALLAELEEEEEQAKSKKSKKKRKKERQQAAKQEEEEKKRQEEGKKAKKAAEKAKKGKQKQEDKSRKKDTSSSQSSFPSKEVASLPSKQSAELASQFDEIDVQLCQLIENGDCEGIEEILFVLKGVPGRAALRKNAKKALKRLRTAKEISAVPLAQEATEPTPKKAPSKTNPESIPSKIKNGVKSVPPAIPATNSGTRLKVVSGTPASKSNRDERVMQMSSTLVGWVIGKGGQRIRDMMEESGAKIWIDQEKAKTADCRNVYISGERKCVDKAAKMVQELVNKAPIGQHQQQQNEHVPQESKPVEIPTPKQPVQEPSKTPVVAKVGNAGMVPTVQKQAEPRAVAIEAVRITEAPAPVVNSVENPIHLPEPTHDSSEIDHKPAFQQILTCEGCFVPLLIGKRGWTIKSIQDESGARVDIDQTVTPRQIKVSGAKANVDVAIRMVRDVLSYPHAQLQQPADGQDPNGLLSASSSHSVTADTAMRTAQPPFPMPSGPMIPPVRQQMPLNRPGARPVQHPGLSAGPAFLMGPPPSITGIGMPPPQGLQPPPPFYGPRDGIGQVPPPGDYMMGSGRRAGPPHSGMPPNQVPPPMVPPSSQPQQQQFPQYTPMDAGARPTAPPSQGLWNSNSSYRNGDGLNTPGPSAPTAAPPTQSLFGPPPEPQLPVRQKDSDLIDSLFGPADKSKADDAQIDALFGLSGLNIGDDEDPTGESSSSGLWGASGMTDWADGAEGEGESKDHQQPPSALPGLTESFLQRGGKALQHPPASRFDWSSMG